MIKWVSLTRRALPLIVCLCAFALYLRTLAPSVAELFDDSLEFQLVGYKLAIAHPTGYPLYTLILKLFTLLPVGEIAYRANLSSAVLSALTVALVYRTALRLTGAIVPSLVSAAALALSPVFWSQAVITEVYALNALLIAAAILFVVNRQSPTRGGSVDLTPLAFLAGLMLAHHRTGLLLLPAAAVCLWLVADRDWRALLSQAATRRSLAAFLLPLALYAYLPLRAAVGSLDETYQNTPEGFLRWISAGGYNIFLTGNPFNEHYDAAFFFQLFLNQFGWLGLIVALVGVGWLLRRNMWAGLFLLIAFFSYLVFVVSYRVPDVQVFAIPAFLIVALALGCGLQACRASWQLALRSRPFSSGGARRALGGANWLSVGGLMLGLALVLVNLALIFQGAWAENDLSGRTELRDYGRDILAQPLPADATLVGILGEMTLVRYFQFAEGLRPALVTIAADRDAERLAVIDRELAAGRAVFTTRPLGGLPEKYSLSALGPLVRVLPRPQPSELPGDSPRVGDIRYRVDRIEQPGASLVRVNLGWEPTAPLSADLKVSARLMDSERLVAQKDDWPVHNAYHTTFWRAGEFIRDAYDVMLPPGTRPGLYSVLLIVYRADSGAEIGRIQSGQIEIRQ
jgi:hypothetical protein